MKLYLKIILLCLCLLPLHSKADDKIHLNRSLIDRQVKNYTILANYSYLDLWIPSKYGLSLSLTPDAKATYDIEYLKAELSLGWFVKDLGSFSDHRISILRRSFNARNSLNFIIGAYYSRTKINIGTKYLSGITPQDNYDILLIENLGITLGIGNRWVLKNGFTFGADWFSAYIPLINLKREDIFTKLTNDEDDRKNANKAIDAFRKIPGFSVLKIQLGYSF